MNTFNIRIILKIIGIALIVESLVMFLCTTATIIYQGNPLPLVKSGIITAIFGGLLFIFNKKANKKIDKQEGYLIISSIWIFLAIFGALPYVFSGFLHQFTDAFFESISGFTTTGSTVIPNVEIVSKDILLWRSLTQWLGGFSIILLSLAIIPIVGISSLQHFSSDIPETAKIKFQLRIKDVAKRILAIYSTLTILQIILLHFGGMGFFDAINHSLTTISTGGFSTHSSNIIITSAYIQYVFILFMCLAGMNFSLSLITIQGKFPIIFRNEEIRGYILVIAANTILVTIILVRHFSLSLSSFANFENTFRLALFQVVSFTSTTGFFNADYTTWPLIVCVLFLGLFIVGGSSCSTSGGLKIVRMIILAKHSLAEFKQLVHPKAIIPVRLQNKPIDFSIISNVLTFTIFYILILICGVVVLTLFENDFETSLGAVATTVGNIGPGFGAHGPLDTFASLNIGSKWILSFLMICGRLELFTIFMLFSPAFWKK
jgi:trk system potassium uptake protein